mmetsp:Transcript_10154/g.33320  ORF Transcript_10154/g.33320 Transcript_10154/m.33320 type:complete len:248 (+) Transcript_10154:1304-2047(+)
MQRLVARDEQRAVEEQRSERPDGDEVISKVLDGLVSVGVALDFRSSAHIADHLVILPRVGIPLARPRAEDCGADGRHEAEDEHEAGRREVEHAAHDGVYRLGASRPRCGRHEPAPHAHPDAHKQEARDQHDRREGKHEEPGGVGEALGTEKRLTPRVEGERFVNPHPSGKHVRQPRRVGGDQNECHLEEADEDLDLGGCTYPNVVDGSAVREAEGRADAGLLPPALPPALHRVGPSCEATRDADAEG